MFFDRYSALCKGKGKTPTGVALELNVSRATVNYWKNGNVPKQETLIKIADYFEVSVDYLLENESKASLDAFGDDALRFALYGNDSEDITKEMLDEIREIALIKREMNRRKNGT